jgi:benzoate-CoA ligase
MPFTPPSFPDRLNMADYFVFSNIDAGRGAKTAILFEDQAITYAEVASRVTRVAQRLLSEGLLPEQRVLLCMRDCPEFVYAWFGAIKAGAVVTQINPLLPTDDYSYYLSYVKPQFAFIDEASEQAFEAARGRSRHCQDDGSVILVGSSSTLPEFDSWLQEECTELEPWSTRKDDPAVWLFTSGTTGHSKGAVHCHFHFPYNTEVYAKSFIGMREQDVTLSGPRLYFGYATGTNLMFPFAVGATSILFREQPSSDKLFELIARHRPTVLTNVPTLIAKMIDAAEGRAPDLSSIRLMWSAGEALPHDLHRRWNERFAVPIIDGIGSAESFHIYISNHPDDIRPGSLGRLVPGYEADLLDEDGNPIAGGEIGVLRIRGDSAALHYHADYAKSKRHLGGGAIVSGDMFRRDPEGYWYYEGRGDDMIKSGGIYVSPLEVEGCISAHQAVGECCVFGSPDDNGLEKPVAVIVLREGVPANAETKADLLAFARARLARYKVPHRISFSSDPLPRNDRDKVDRKKMRETYP